MTKSHTEQPKPDWWQPPYEGNIFQGCLNCPPVERLAPMDMVIAVGFGNAYVSKDEHVVWSESNENYTAEREGSDPHYLTVQDAEDAALKDPGHNWIIAKHAPLRSAVWQRHGASEWVLISSGKGFA